MSITDELRKFAWKECPSKFLERVIGIADDIDKKHEAYADFAHRMKDAASKGEEVTIFGTDYIPLPKDADGKTIHIGDELEWLDGNRLTVNGIGEGGTLFYVDAQGDVQWTASGDKRHVKPDSWEAIIEEAASYGSKRQFSGTQGDKAIIAELVERCKRLAGEDA